MALSAIKLRISAPTEPILPGRGFYQLEEESLYVQIGPFTRKRRFFSYLESESVRFDLDRKGRLIFIEVAVARRRWRVDPAIKPPLVVAPGDIRWLDFRKRIKDPLWVTSPGRECLLLRFNNDSPLRSYYMAEEVIAQVDNNRGLSAIWITDIVDDLAGQEIRSFRKELRREPASRVELSRQ